MDNTDGGRVFGYARVSSTEQNLDRQLRALSEYVPEENIVTDKQSGKDLDRAGYQALKGRFGLRRGDTLYVMSLDRLSRSKSDIKGELQWFQENGIRLMILDLPTSMIEVPSGQEWITEMINNILIEVISSMAEQERLTIRKRQRQGIEVAKSKGKHLGRPFLEKPKNYEMVVEQWKNKEVGTLEASKRLGVSKTTFYQMLKRYSL
jgi:DNA invertase Pin-like site-specific DNA recombinase